MNRTICISVFLAAAFLFGFGVWVYETKFWADYPIFFSVGSALLFCLAVFLAWAGRKNWGLIIASCVTFLFWFFSIIPLIQKTHWSGSSKQELSIRVLDANTGQGIPEASVALFDAHENFGQAETDIQGKTKIKAVLSTSGSSSLFNRSGGIQFMGLKVKVESDSYQSGQFDFEEKMAWWPLYGAPIPEIEIRLNKK